MTAIGLRHLRRLCGAAAALAAAACQGSDVTSPSTGGLPATATTSAALSLSGHIAFQSTRAGNAEIYVMKADGSGVTRLTNNPANDGQPAWSPSGAKIAFVSDRAGNSEIYVMNANGSGVTRITHNAAVDKAPAWSPDGSKIVFVSNRVGHDEIYVMNANGSGVTRLTNNLPIQGCNIPCTRFEEAPTWSPDGSKIAFAHKASIFGFAIRIMNPNGTGGTQLAVAAGLPAPTKLAWSPNGTRIAFDRRFGSSDDREVVAVNANGTSLTQLTNNTATDAYPTWSPNGTALAFESDRDGDFELYAMNANGTGVTQLTHNAVFDGEPGWR